MYFTTELLGGGGKNQPLDSVTPLWLVKPGLLA